MVKSGNLLAKATLFKLQESHQSQQLIEPTLVYINLEWPGSEVLLNFKVYTLFSKSGESKGNRTRCRNSFRDSSLSPKSISGVEFTINSFTASHPYSSLACKHQSKMALRTLSSDVTVKSVCWKMKSFIVREIYCQFNGI